MDLPPTPDADATRHRRSSLTPDLVQGWVDAYRAEHDGKFPTARSGPIPDADKTWSTVDQAMRTGASGWPVKTSLPLWLDMQYPQERGVLAPQTVRAWVDAYRAEHDGKFPTKHSGPIAGAKKLWSAVDRLMSTSGFAWPVKTSLQDWLDDQYPHERGILTPQLVRTWVDEFRAAHDGNFPIATSGPIPGTDKSWKAVDGAMRQGRFGWPVITSLPRWLDEQYALERHRRHRIDPALERPDGNTAAAASGANLATDNDRAPAEHTIPARSVDWSERTTLPLWVDEQPPHGRRVLTPQDVRAWVDAYRAAHDNQFPDSRSGPIPGTNRTWISVDQTMRAAQDCWVQPTTLRRWLDEQYPERPLRQWVEAYRAEHDGKFPTVTSGPIPGAGKTWGAVDQAMRLGRSGWPAKSSLPNWLDQQYPQERGLLTPQNLRAWVDAYRAEHDGQFPASRSGEIPGQHKSWAAVDQAMRDCTTGWTQKTTLSRWLDEQYPERLALAGQLTAELVRQWVDQYRATHDNRFPVAGPEPIPGVGKTWGALDYVMTQGVEGWPHKTSLSKWLDTQYAERQLTPEMVRVWVDDYRAANDGRFPSQLSGPIPGTDKTWNAVHGAMWQGSCGWQQKTTLSQWLDANYPDRHLTPALLRTWVDDYRAGHDGQFPSYKSGAIPGAGRTWIGVQQALGRGVEGWDGPVTLSAWLDQQYPEERAMARAQEARDLVDRMLMAKPRKADKR